MSLVRLPTLQIPLLPLKLALSGCNPTNYGTVGTSAGTKPLFCGVFSLLLIIDSFRPTWWISCAQGDSL